MLPRFFTITQLLRFMKIDEHMARHPQFTRALAFILVNHGYTQRIFREGSSIERTWSKDWVNNAIGDQLVGVGKKEPEWMKFIRQIEKEIV